MFKRILRYRQAQQKLVDKRGKLLSEIISNIRAVKLYAYETHFAKQISAIRIEELTKLRQYGLIRSAVTSTFAFTPVLAAVRESALKQHILTLPPVTFVTYSLSGHKLDVPIVFSSLQFFNVLRQPISNLPTQISSCMDAASAMGR